MKFPGPRSFQILSSSEKENGPLRTDLSRHLPTETDIQQHSVARCHSRRTDHSCRVCIYRQQRIFVHVRTSSQRFVPLQWRRRCCTDWSSKRCVFVRNLFGNRQHFPQSCPNEFEQRFNNGNARCNSVRIAAGAFGRHLRNRFNRCDIQSRQPRTIVASKLEQPYGPCAGCTLSRSGSCRVERRRRSRTARKQSSDSEFGHCRTDRSTSCATPRRSVVLQCAHCSVPEWRDPRTVASTVTIVRTLAYQSFTDLVNTCLIFVGKVSFIYSDTA